VSPSELVNCVFTSWSPTLGDPTVMGWVTVVCYLAATVLSAFTSYSLIGRQRVFWLGLTVLLLALAINKQLDLQSALTEAGRCLAKAQRWYEERQSVQVKFIFWVMATSLVAALLSAWVMRHDLGKIWLALVGLAFLVAFIAVRAAGFHHFDRFIGFAFGSIRMNWVLELGGIAAIIGNALFLLLRCRVATR
jgi:FtsH-binding integral membrane protein